MEQADWVYQIAPLSLSKNKLNKKDEINSLRACFFERTGRNGVFTPCSKKLLEDYGVGKGFSVAKEFAVSESASGKQIRKTFNEMLQYARQHQVRAILCEKIDRLTRNLKDAAAVQDWVIEHPENQVHFVKEGFILNQNTKAHENLVWDMKVAIARFYTNNLSEEVRKGQKEKLAQGWLPRRAMLGYRTIGEKGHKTHVWDEVRAPLIRQMFELFDTGNYSLKTLSAVMYKNGLRGQKGGRIARGTIDTYLKEPFYYGKILWKGQLYDGKHKPIISKDLFDSVHRKLSRTIAHPTYSKHETVFKAKILCEECRGMITWEIQKGHWYGHCNHFRGCTKKKYMRQEEAEKQLFPYFDGVAPRDEETLAILKEALQISHADEVDYNAVKRNELERITRVADRRIEEAYKDKLDGKMPTDICEKVIRDSTQEKKRLPKSWQSLQRAAKSITRQGMPSTSLLSKPRPSTTLRRPPLRISACS